MYDEPDQLYRLPGIRWTAGDNYGGELGDTRRRVPGHVTRGGEDKPFPPQSTLGLRTLEKLVKVQPLVSQM